MKWSTLVNRTGTFRDDFVSAWRLSPVERTVAFSVLGVGIIAYFLFHSQALLHNHTARLPYALNNDQIWAGRWFNLILYRLNYGADTPVLLPLQSVLMAVTTSIIALRLWCANTSFWRATITGSWIVAFPFALSLFYFSYQTPLFYIAWIFAALAAWCLRTPSALRIFGGGLLIMLVCASYQAMLSVFAVLVATAALVDLGRFDKDGTPTDLLLICRRCAASLLALVLGLVFYWLSLEILNLNGPGNTSITSLMDLPGRIWAVSLEAFKHLWITQPELLRSQKTTLMLILSTAVVVHLYSILRNRLFGRTALALFVWVIAIVSTKFIFIIVSPAGSIFEYRYNTSFAFLYAFAISILTGPTVRLVNARRLAYAVGAAMIFIFIHADLVRQLVLLRGQQHDLALSNRILARVESLPSLEPDKVYDFVRIGRYPTYRNRLMRSSGRTWDKAGDRHMDWGEVSGQWVDEDVMRLLGASVQFKYALTDSQFIAKEKKAREQFLDNRKPWPDATSVFIVEDTIYVYMQ